MVKKKGEKKMTYSACVEGSCGVGIAWVVGTSENHSDKEEAQNNRGTHVLCYVWKKQNEEREEQKYIC